MSRKMRWAQWLIVWILSVYVGLCGALAMIALVMIALVEAATK